MSKYAVIIADLNSDEIGRVLSKHNSEDAANKAMPDIRGAYVALRKPDGQWESRIEASDRRENFAGKAYKPYIELPYGQQDGEQFSQWLRKQGYQCHIGNTAGAFIDGMPPQNPDDEKLITALWQRYCNEVRHA